ncbi:MAG: hypothetical protein FJ286_16200 [Planctomycetes bacterium]|nr:hypothetical protein [Planctomycetota bacterium]
MIRSGQIADRIAASGLNYQVEPGAHWRSGTMRVEKAIDGYRRSFSIKWQIKGAFYHAPTRTASAYLFLYIHTDEALSTRNQTRQMIANIAMPVQQFIFDRLPRQEIDLPRMRALVIHHRSHEVARTLQTIQNLGYRIDSFIGIPYGDVGWDYITMLDHASDHHYLSLKTITHPTEPNQYQIDFRQSSFLDVETEQAIATLYEDPAIAGDYLTAMQALAEYRLVCALRACREHGERLIVYEDGGYVVARIYDIYRDPGHPSHSLIKAAIDDGLIVGAVEVTVAGERKNQQVIEENDGRALLPVLSSARSDIKAVYEAVGVAEAVIHAAASSFGRLGLPTFQARRVAVIGGNGAIGARLVEQFTLIHNSTANVFAVDISERPFALEIDRESLPHAAARLRYHRLPRYVVAEGSLPVILDRPYSDQGSLPDRIGVAQAIRAFLAGQSRYQELALTNSYPLPAADLKWLWQTVAQQSGYRLAEATALPEGGGQRFLLHNGDQSRAVAMLAASTVLTFKDASRPIRNGVNTIVGSTGYPIFSARNLDDFFMRPNPSSQTDELTLISASSKDYEFRRAIDLLDMFLKLQTRLALPADLRLGWFAGLYRDAMSFVQGQDFAALQRLIAAPLSDQAFRSFVEAEPALAAVIGLAEGSEACWRDRLADYITGKIRQRVNIRKAIRPDIGSIYHVTVNGQAKRVVLLADGLVVNFFARHEKGVKTEFIDPIVTMQVLSLVKLTAAPLAPGLYKMDAHLRPEDLATFWSVINDSCSPLAIA